MGTHIYINIIVNNKDNFSIEKKSKLNRFMGTSALWIADLTRLGDARLVDDLLQHIYEFYGSTLTLT